MAGRGLGRFKELAVPDPWKVYREAAEQLPRSLEGGTVNRGVIGAIVGVLVIIILVIIILRMT